MEGPGRVWAVIRRPADTGRATTTKRGNFAADLLQVQQSAIVCTMCNCKAVGQKAHRWPLDGSWQRAGQLSYLSPAPTHAPGPVRATAQQLKPIDDHPYGRDFAPAHLCDHFASGRRQDDTH